MTEQINAPRTFTAGRDAPSARWFLKGEGTGNDFVVMVDLSGEPGPTPGFVRSLCDRRRGIGADGLLRVSRAAGNQQSGASYFMDYRNADGSIAEMCGNGARVFAAALRALGLEEATDFLIQTRGGLRRVIINPDATVSIGMGLPRLAAGTKLVSDVVDGVGHAIWMPNPHAVFEVPEESVLAVLDLSKPPKVGPVDVFPQGVNVEFVTSVSDHHIRMRVHERGVGETLSCGTGACAAAVASAIALGEGPADPAWRVDVPGGTLSVAWGRDDLFLTGPATLVAAGELDEEWLRVNG